LTDNTIGNLRNYLFESLDRLADKSLRGDALREELERAKVINDTSGRICDTARIQTDRMKVMEQLQSPDSFLEGEVTRRQITQGPGNE
jgi:hypothetical protein